MRHAIKDMMTMITIDILLIPLMVSGKSLAIIVLNATLIDWATMTFQTILRIPQRKIMTCKCI